mgnify:FL=1
MFGLAGGSVLFLLVAAAIVVATGKVYRGAKWRRSNP